MDRRYSSGLSVSAAQSPSVETANHINNKKPTPTVASALNSSIRYRHGLPIGSTAISANHRKSFPSTSDIGSSFSTIQVNYSLPLSVISFFLTHTHRHPPTHTHTAHLYACLPFCDLKIINIDYSIV